MSALELDTLDYGDCLDLMQRGDDQCVELILPECKPWTLGTQRQEDLR